jgi:hypothetical protein
MTMQTDVKSQHLNTSGAIFEGRARVKSVIMCANASVKGTLIIYNGTTNVLEIDVPSNSNPNSFNVIIPGEGILCTANVYATMSNLASVTVFYG